MKKTSYVNNKSPEPQQSLNDKEIIRARCGENKQITDGNYDKSLAVKCVNGTFVGKKAENIIEYKGIPFVSEQPVGKNRFKKPVPYGKDEGVYEAYHFGKGSLQPETPDDRGSLAVLGEDCLYLNIWKIEGEYGIVDWERTYPLTKYFIF